MVVHFRTGLLATCLLLALSAQALEPAHTMQSAAERAAETPAGRWQGHWLVLRDDPRIRTRAGAQALRLLVTHDASNAVAEVDWRAERAICDNPVAEPCEWVGQSGRQTGLIVGEALVISLPLSADSADPHWLRIDAPLPGAHGDLLTGFGTNRHTVELQADN